MSIFQLHVISTGVVMTNSQPPKRISNGKKRAFTHEANMILTTFQDLSKRKCKGCLEAARKSKEDDGVVVEPALLKGRAVFKCSHEGCEIYYCSQCTNENLWHHPSSSLQYLPWIKDKAPVSTRYGSWAMYVRRANTM